jgi:hypothetical protein
MDNTLAHILATTQAKPTGPDQWIGHCRAHGSKKHRDLSIKLNDNKILLHCFAACPKEEVVSALGLTVQDLFTDAPLARGKRSAPKPVRVDRLALAFQFELAALDLRLRAEKIIEAGKLLDVNGLSDHELDLAIGHAAQAHADVKRAELFEGVADDLRTKEFLERDHARQKRVA